MECKGIQEKLSAYLEKMVSPEEKQLIEEHLTSCGLCRSTLEDLKRTGELVRDLEEVEPPPWLAKKIMSRIRAEEEGKRGIFQKLFYPLHIKIPIEALATVFIAVIAVYMFKAVEPDLKSVPLRPGIEPALPRVEAPGQLQQPGVASSPKKQKAVPQGSPEPVQEKVSAAARDESSLETRIKEKRVSKAAKEELPAPEIKQPSPAPAFTEEKGEEGAGRSEAGKGPAELQRPEALRQQRSDLEPDRKEKEQLAFSAARDAGERKAQAGATPLKKMADKKTEPMDIKVYVRDMSHARQEIEALLAQMGAYRIETKSQADRAIINAVLKSEKVEELIEKLKQTGELQDREAYFGSLQGEASIRIEIFSNR